MIKNPIYFSTLAPAIYKVVYDKINKTYLLIEESKYFILPKKIYGNLEKYAHHFWKHYLETDDSTGVVLTGDPGTGKTELAKIICNLALSVGLPVIKISDIKGNIDLIRFLANYDNVILFFDEFGKIFSIYEQEQMLTFLSDIQNSKKFFILTENEKERISNFILNRPGRIRYSLTFKRLSKEVVEEFCKDNNVRKDFLEELLIKYEKAVYFSFDHLSAIVSEHKLFPESNLDELLEVLNLDIFRKKIYLLPIEVKDSKGMNVEFKSEYTELETFMQKYSKRILIKIVKGNNIYVDKDDIKKVKDKKYILEKDGYVIILAEIEEKELNLYKDIWGRASENMELNISGQPLSFV